MVLFSNNPKNYSSNSAILEGLHICGLIRKGGTVQNLQFNALILALDFPLGTFNIAVY